MKNFIKYIYIIAIFGLMGFWSQNVLAEDPCGGRGYGTVDGKIVCFDPSDKEVLCAEEGGTWTNGECNVAATEKNCPSLGGTWKGGSCIISEGSSTSSDCGPDKYIRSSMKNTCQPKLCIGHSNKYCECVAGGKTLECEYNECIGAYYENGSYKQKGDQKFCDCVANGGTELAVSIPFVGGTDGSDRCVPKSKSGEALPLLIGVIIQILNTLLLVGGFAMFVYAGVLRVMQQSEKDLKLSKDIMRGVFGAFALYGSLGLLLRLINPVLFT